MPLCGNVQLRVNWPTMMTLGQRNKVIMLEVKLEWKLNGTIEETVDHWNVD